MMKYDGPSNEHGYASVQVRLDRVLLEGFYRRFAIEIYSSRCQLSHQRAQAALEPIGEEVRKEQRAQQCSRSDQTQARARSKRLLENVPTS